MNLSQLLAEELQNEANNTRKILQQVPEGNNDWRPHEKSFPLGRLATHVAEIPRWVTMILGTPGFDMLANPLPRHVAQSHAELMEIFESQMTEALANLKAAGDEELLAEWTFRAGERIISNTSRYHTIRTFMFNHHIHHRGQLSVYLRLLDVPVPGMYGPSADDRIAMEKAQAN